MNNPEKNKLELESIREKNRLCSIIDASPTSIWYKDTLNNFIRVNKAAVIIAGRTSEEVEEKSTDEIFPLESERFYKDDFEVIISVKSKINIIEPATTEGKTTLVRNDTHPWFAENGKIAGVIAFSCNITDFIEV